MTTKKQPTTFHLGDKVRLAVSGERGEVVGIAIYSEQPESYYVRYKAADGRQVETWWMAGALRAAK